MIILMIVMIIMNIMMINEIDDKCSKYIEMGKILIILIVEIYMKIQYIWCIVYVVECVSVDICWCW